MGVWTPERWRRLVSAKLVVACMQIADPKGMGSKGLCGVSSTSADLMALSDWFSSLAILRAAMKSCRRYSLKPSSCAFRLRS